MNDEIVKLEEYKNTLINKKALDEKSKTVDDLSLEELEDVEKLYINEIYQLSNDIKVLEKENEQLRRILDK